MKGVILAGGTGTRLRPLTQLINKHLLPVGRHPMVYYAIEKLREAQIDDILIITGKQSADLYANFCGNGSQWQVKLTYKIQDEAGGIAEALGLAEGFIQSGEKFVVLLGDNLFDDDLTPYVTQYLQQKEAAKILLKEVDDASRYGVPTLADSKIVEIQEKPTHPKSNYCVTGIYMYNSDVFNLIRSIKPSARGELEITDVNNRYAKDGQLTYNILNEWWTDAGTFESLYEASHHLINK